MFATMSKTRSASWAAAISVAAAAAVLFGLVSASLSRSSAMQRPAPTVASAELATPAVMLIAPAPVIDPSAERFVGTGDGSNGSWSQP